jgi:hypothetical protein
MSSPFDYVNQILYGNKQLIVDEITEQGYKPFLINRSLSYQKDCIFYANEMNRFHHLENKLQNDFLLNTIRKSKRPFAKWVKAEKSDDIECIKMVYGISNSKAKEVLQILTKEQLKEVKETADIGGVGKK